MSYDITLTEHLVAEQREAAIGSAEIARFVRDVRRPRRPRLNRRFVRSRQM